MKTKMKWIAIGILAFMSIATLASAGIPDTLKFAIENATQTIFTVDKLGHANFTGNIKTDQDLYVDGSLVCSDCIGDEDVSDTLTASNLVAGSSVVSDAEVDNDITIDGGTINLGTNTYSGLLGYNNLTKCSDTQILKMSGANWACAADESGAGGNTTEEVQDAAWDVLTGTQTGITVTYEDETNDVDFVVTDSYVDTTGDTMTGNLNMNAANITDTNTNAFMYFDGSGGLVVHLEA